ncbi:hypothetical protein QUF55_06965 [Clostridiaceae bacterium HSG29]|nr:hypothetical protein [Clostridiaceae bacterium HSG29]
MVAKNIFEKLGLIEAVEEKNEEKEALKDSVENSEDVIDELLNVKEIDETIVKREEEIIENQDKIDKDDIENKLDVLIESYEKNRLLSIDDIYRNARLTLDTKKSIFMVDILSKTLPENLPVDIKRGTVLSLMEVSELNKDSLLNDAYQRIDSLNTVMEETVETTETIINKNNMTIKELKKRISELEKINDERVEFQKDQNTLIEYEIQKVINLVDFVKPKK